MIFLIISTLLVSLAYLPYHCTLATTVSDDLLSAKRALDVPQSPVPPTTTYYDLGPDNFTEWTSSGSWFVDFMAPWCPHCRDLDPEWTRLSRSAKDTEYGVRFGKVDCEQHRKLCADEKIDGMPTIKHYRGGKAKVYEGARSEQGMRSYLLAQRKANIGAVAAGKLDETLAEHQASFWLLYKDGTEGAQNAVKNFVRASGNNNDLGETAFFASKSGNAIEAINGPGGVGLPNVFFVLATSTGSVERVIGFPGSLEDSDTLDTWLANQSDQLRVAKLDGDTATRLIWNDKPGLVVLAIVPGTGSHRRRRLAEVHRALRTFREQEPAKPKKSVRFAWVDPKGGGQDYLANVLQVREPEKPKVVVVDPYDDAIWDMTPTTYEDILLKANDIVEAALAVQSGKWKPRYYKSEDERRERRVRRSVEGFFVWFQPIFPFALLAILLFASYKAWMFCWNCLRRKKSKPKLVDAKPPPTVASGAGAAALAGAATTPAKTPSKKNN